MTADDFPVPGEDIVPLAIADVRGPFTGDGNKPDTFVIDVRCQTCGQAVPVTFTPWMTTSGAMFMQSDTSDVYAHSWAHD